MRRLAALVAALGLALCAPASAPVAASSPARPLQTAIVDSGTFLGPEAALALRRVRQAGATMVRLPLSWRAIAPAGPARPAGFEPANPADPRYNWAPFDRQLRLAAQAGLEPIVYLYHAPDWAERAKGGPEGTNAPDPRELGLFARAAARRYSGSFQGLPRVRYWQVWNEPNISLFFNPQFEGKTPFSPAWYRRMVNEVAAAVKAVRADNQVIAGGTAPFRDITPRVLEVDQDWGPLSFMRELLCLGSDLKPTCRERARFDIWGHDPYTSGGPTRQAVLPNDVSLGDLPEMRAVLEAGVKAGNVVPGRNVRFWVLELTWDSKPPDPRGVPLALQARWVAEGLYRAWQSGVTLVTWFLLRDEPLAQSPFQSGLYFRGATLAQDRPKPALAAFRFPVVAFPQGGGVYVWGRTPAGERGRVVVEQRVRGPWRRLAVLSTDRYGIFQQTFAGAPRQGLVRARFLGPSRLFQGVVSVPFSLRQVPDRTFTPFGLPYPLEPGRPSR